MVNVDVGNHQRTDVVNGEINGKVRSGGAPSSVLALEKAAVYEDAPGFCSGV